jgi:beta-mannanase
MGQNTTGATPFPLGVFVGNPNYFDSNEEASFEANFNAFSDLMKTKPQFLDQYGDQRLPISGWVGQASWNAASMAQSPVLKDVTPVIGLPMTSTASGSGTPDQFYKNFATGKYDSVLKDMVKAWADNGFTTQIWRPGWEMNIDTMPSYAGGDAATRADWVKAFQHIYTVLHAAGQAEGVNVQVAWNPSVVNYSHAGNVIETAYPGNRYVDIIAADVYGDVFPYGSPTHLYDWDRSGQVLNSSHPVYDTSVQQWAADPVNLGHYYTYPASNQWSLDGSVGHATTLQQLIDLAKSTGKPFAIAETGAGNTHDGAGLTDNPTFVQWLADTLHRSGVKVSFMNIWNSNSGGQYRFTSSADHKPLEAAAWAKFFGDPPTSASASAPATTESSLAPTVTQVSASPGTGIEHAGDATTLTLGFNEAVTVTGTPTLSLNDGDTAAYVGGSGTGTLTFRTTVASTDTNTSALAITGVNLANGASIHDASGAGANLAGALKTFSGLQVATSSTSPSTPSTPPSTPSTPSSIAPVLTVADSTLSVAGRGGTVGLGVNVTTTDPNDAVTVNITGLPKYETITDKLDGKTFGGNNVTLTAAEVDSGLVLQSNYRGGGHPVATLTLTAAGKDPSTGAVTTSASQTITVTDPRPATATTTTSPQTITVTDPAPATGTTTTSPQTISLTNPAPATDTTTAFPAGKGFAWLGQHQDQAASTVTTAEPQAITAKNPWPATIGSLANQGFVLLQQHLDGATGVAPISVPQTMAETDSAPATGKAMASLASQSFALLNQYLAGNAGRVDRGQIVAAVSNGTGWGQDSILTRPQH